MVRTTAPWPRRWCRWPGTLVEPPTLLPVAAPDCLRYGIIRAIKLFDRVTKFPAYQRFMSLSVPVLQLKRPV